MIFLSAQPDDFYFTWQVELLVFNLNKLCIQPQHIHILIGYSPKRGLQHFFSDVIQKNRQKANFYVYPDNRVNSKYLPSLRPHLIQQHFRAFPQLQKETLFYHDSDIILVKLPNFQRLIDDNIWYVSDTRNYLDSQYIRQNGSEALFVEMCRTVGILEETVAQNDGNCGGAQYLLKNTTLDFWNKVEIDCEGLFGLMDEYNIRKAEDAYTRNGQKRSATHGIQSWCADMWAVFWNGLLFERDIRIAPELGFCTSQHPIENLKTNNILHYTGSQKRELFAFQKTEFMQYKPFRDLRLKQIATDIVDFELVNTINEFTKELNKERISLPGILIVIPVHLPTRSQYENLYTIVQYFSKYIDIRFMIIDIGTDPNVDKALLSDSCEYLFCKKDKDFLSCSDELLLLGRLADQECIVFCDTDTCFPIEQLLTGIEHIRTNKFDALLPFESRLIRIDLLFREQFRKILDTELFSLNKEKFMTGDARHSNGPVFIKPQQPLAKDLCHLVCKSPAAGLTEIYIVLKEKGYDIRCMEGPLYQLPNWTGDEKQYKTIDFPNVDDA